MNLSTSNSDQATSPLVEMSELAETFRETRAFTATLCEPMEIEDMVAQSMPDASPVVWHLAHTTWFFETFLLKPFSPGYEPFHPQFEYLFNSYYNAVGEQFTRADRGLLTRPTVAQVRRYRESVEGCVNEFLAAGRFDDAASVRATVELGIQHEQQHQELILTDLKHLLSRNPLAPAYRSLPDVAQSSNGTATTNSVATAAPIRFVDFPEQLAWIGYDGDEFAFDNERPRHRQFVEAFGIANRLVTNGEYLAFMEAGGYKRPEHWLSMGWAAVSENRWQSPLYWTQRDGRWCEFTLDGIQPLQLDGPVCHISYFEADAYARFAGMRLPTEAEWEIVASQTPVEGHFAESLRLHPGRATGNDGIDQMFGDCWQWTASPYVGYPGYRPPSGAIGEYNGKFMCNQYVLRGGSVATSRSHIRASYRNFFPPQARWQFTGIRLAK
ncbi:Iron(II)-dependent oxidoreductase EgtB [Rosistilla ulvae]|uniref:Iron(II)-dependent oxidoreductase EgtB n=1 Tax=Rosistilla ulvae TaxID=1930277 RepID=A0A517LXU9_9BACT|nr:ergothioneine biosynthesis protein EgtB [Rosistilla ulvae]QDS87443.1 Iron(II)-dependent oxidoreductase EgtB [Rosistilla ulvae]